MSEYKKPKRKIMRTFKLSEISGVDMPAQKPATAVLIKRNEKDSNELVEKAVLLSTVEDGHQHLVEVTFDVVQRGGGHTSYTDGTPVSPDGGMHSSHHDHGFVINPDGSITIAAASGHTHEIEVTEFMGRLRLQAALADKGVTDLEVAEVALASKNNLPASCYALVPDPTKPSTWKYPLGKSSSGTFNPRCVGSAIKAIEQNRIPKKDLAEVTRRVRKAWIKCHDQNASMPNAIRRVF